MTSKQLVLSVAPEARVHQMNNGKFFLWIGPRWQFSDITFNDRLILEGTSSNDLWGRALGVLTARGYYTPPLKLHPFNQWRRV